MFTIEPNTELEASLDAAYKNPTVKVNGKAKLTFTDKGSCVIVLKNDERVIDTIVLDNNEAEVHFFHDGKSGNYGTTGKPSGRYRTRYVISSGTGCLIVDGRRRAMPQIKYRQDTGHRRASSAAQFTSLTLSR